VWETRVFYGSTVKAPALSCTCQAGRFGNTMCSHKQKLLAGMREVHKNWQYSNNPTNWENGCDACAGAFEKDEKFVRVDVQTTNMRGDDDVFCFHKTCWNGNVANALRDGSFKSILRDSLI
jgi:hypothetical protein